MATKYILTVISVGALLAACATQKESPIYQQSTKYKVHSPYEAPAQTPAHTPAPVTEYASYPSQIQHSQTPAPAVVSPYPGVQPLAPQSTVIATDSTIIRPSNLVTLEAPSQQAPTDQAYGDTFGTPGYHAMQANGETVSSAASASAATASAAALPPLSETVTIPEPPRITAPAPTYPQAAARSYIPPSAAIRAPAPTIPQAPQTAPFDGNSAHKVVEGDTVYSLSRNLCVSVADIKSLNGLDGTFSIRLDDYIRLPASRC